MQDYVPDMTGGCAEVLHMVHVNMLYRASHGSCMDVLCMVMPTPREWLLINNNTLICSIQPRPHVNQDHE